MEYQRQFREDKMQDDFEARTWRLLEAFYELSNGNPGEMVRSDEAAERANIPHTTEDFNPVAMHLRDSGLVREQGKGLLVFTITPAGVHAVNENRPPTMMA
jgi:hypothetical protein